MSAFGKFVILGADLWSCHCWVAVLCSLVSVVLFGSCEYLVVLFCLVGSSRIPEGVTTAISLYVFLVIGSLQMALEKGADKIYRRREEEKHGVPP